MELHDLLVKTFKWHKILKYLAKSTAMISGGAVPTALSS